MPLNLPIGSVQMWSGSIGSIPAGWALCDGNYGTPNLRNRFIFGNIVPNGTGGASIHIHTGAEPPHFHFADFFGFPSVVQSGNGYNFMTDGISTQYTFDPNSNLPLYYALAYIQRIN